METLPVEPASKLAEEGPQTQWLIDSLWAEQAVGILGGEPKCCKTFLALDMAVSVATGTPCLRKYPVTKAGKVLLFPAEDSIAIVRKRLEGICKAANQSLENLPVNVITSPTLRLDLERDTQLLTNTVEVHRPDLLILDPLIRLHRVEENDASQMAALLSYLRQLQRNYQVAIVVVHHARKSNGRGRPGQALRGSSELHGWGDSNLYLRRSKEKLTLTTEHRSAASCDDIEIQLTSDPKKESLSLELSQSASVDTGGSVGPLTGTTNTPTASEKIRAILEQQQSPIKYKPLRALCAMRSATVSAALSELTESGVVIKQADGYQLAIPAVKDNQIEQEPAKEIAAVAGVSASHPIERQGTGNGKPKQLAEQCLLEFE